MLNEPSGAVLPQAEALKYHPKALLAVHPGRLAVLPAAICSWPEFPGTGVPTSNLPLVIKFWAEIGVTHSAMAPRAKTVRMRRSGLTGCMTLVESWLEVASAAVPGRLRQARWLVVLVFMVLFWIGGAMPGMLDFLVGLMN